MSIVLETERLFLRHPEPGDAEGFIAFAATERAAYVGGPKTRDEAWRAFAAVLGHWQMRGFGLFAVTYKNSDEPLGLIGNWYPEGWPEREVGWTLWDTAAEGQNIAHEAATAVLAHTFDTLGWTTAVSYIDHPNARSIALATRLGATPDADAQTPRDSGCLVYRHAALGTSQ